MTTKKDDFFRKMDDLGLALSYGDVRLRTKHSNHTPNSVDVSSQFSRNVHLNIPFVSAAMDKVTRHKMAIEMAKLGGLGIIDRVLPPREQAQEVARVKFYLNGLIKKPITVQGSETIEEIINRLDEKDFRSIPVLDSSGRLVGILTGNDFDFCIDNRMTASQIMSTDLITVPESTSIEEAFQVMHHRKKKVLPVVNRDMALVGMYVFSDVKRIMTGGSLVYNLDENGNLRVGAAIGVGDDALNRVEMLVDKSVDVVVIDTAHGDSDSVLNTLREIKRVYGDSLDVVVGNVSEGESARQLADVGADGIKIGQGPGSICTTRVVAGIGCPQVTAVYNCTKAIEGSGIPCCADGGIEYSGDITIALAVGARTVMMGNMLAGTAETPGKVIMRQGIPVKVYRGQGSLGAMQESKSARDRYQQGEQEDIHKLVPEGVEGVVPFKGPVADIVFQCLGGLRSGMGYVGAKNIIELQERADFYRISGSGLKESHPHNILITEKAPNYCGTM
jgi:IMP dehydrogenase